MIPNQTPEGFGPITGPGGAPAYPDTAQAGYKPEINIAPPPSFPQNKPNQAGQKKQILQKLMDNLFNKPGRSFHELVNGIKTAINTYKTYSNEWDTLNGSMGGVIGGAVGGPAGVAGGSAIQKILQGIQQKKNPQDGGGGPGMPMSIANQPPAVMHQPPRMVAPQTVNPPANGIPPIGGMPPLPRMDNQNGYKTPPPVSNLGIYGY
jgi:hypothetical protein